MAASLLRLTIFALITSMEADLQRLIKENCGEIAVKSIKNDDKIIAKAKYRYELDGKDTPQKEIQLSDICKHFDFKDTYKFICNYHQQFPPKTTAYIRKNVPIFKKISLIRNRVMHPRPLEPEDFALTFDTCNIFSDENKTLWQEIASTLEKIASDEGYVLRLDIPEEFSSKNRIKHNLPLADFDDTGLIGRDGVISNIKKLCKSSYNIISILGEGGIGKSATALKAAYEILDDDSYDFDAIMWVTSKTTQISHTEIIEIRGAINDSLGLFTELSQSLSGDANNPINEVLDYLETFKILLFIDNLETILDSRTRDFFGALHSIQSKIVITSRIGLGAFEYPLKLQGLDASSAARLAKQLIKMRSVKSLDNISQETLDNYCQRLNYNPGYIKWFVSTVGTGLQPEIVLQQHSDIFLEFCMSNVYRYLQDDTKIIISLFLLVPGWQGYPELDFFAEKDPAFVQNSVIELLSTNMLIETSKSYQNSIRTLYQLSELARAYLAKAHKISDHEIERITKLKNQLRSIQDDDSIDDIGAKKYEAKSIKLRDKSDAIVAKYLRDALDLIRANDLESAFKKLDTAKQVSSDYFEVHRILGYYYTLTGNYVEARNSYNLAITLNPTYPVPYNWYGQFLIRFENSIEEAIKIYKKAIELDAASYDLKFSLIRCHLYIKQFKDADNLITNIGNSFVSGTHPPTLRERKIYNDLVFQFMIRYAEVFLAPSELSTAISWIKKAINFYDSIPQHSKDNIISSKLRKIIPILYTIEQKDTACELTQDINHLRQRLEALDSADNRQDKLKTRRYKPPGVKG